jgi:enoyl-[acyl-carrier protein] reductase II
MKARYEGKVDEGGMAAGQISGLIREVKPAGQIVHDIVEEAMAVLHDGLRLT